MSSPEQLTNRAGVVVFDGTAAPGGGSQLVKTIPFAFNLANLATGVTIYAPTPGEVLLSAWFSILTAWDGTTPKGDIYTDSFFAYEEAGMFAFGGAGVMDMTRADDTGSDLAFNTSTPPLYYTTPGARIEQTPFVFTTANPLKLVVSQDGTPSGGDPGADAGSGVLYLVTGTPA